VSVHPAVTWTLDAIKSNWSAGAYSDIPIERIDRDESELLDGNIRDRTQELQDSNYVGASFADRDPTPIGTNYDHQVEVVVGIRIEGLHHSEWGYVDADASLPPATAGEAVPFGDLVREIRTSILDGREFPSAGPTNVTFTDLIITNEAPQSDDWQDYYRHDFDVVFGGFEELS
jgi:hypothetical protein